MSARPEDPTVTARALQPVVRSRHPGPAGRLWLGCALALLLPAVPARAADPPSWLPRYDLDIRLDVEQHQVTVRELVTWTNTRPEPTNKIVFNAHSHYA